MYIGHFSGMISEYRETTTFSIHDVHSPRLVTLRFTSYEYKRWSDPSMWPLSLMCRISFASSQVALTTNSKTSYTAVLVTNAGYYRQSQNLKRCPQSYLQVHTLKFHRNFSMLENFDATSILGNWMIRYSTDSRF